MKGNEFALRDEVFFVEYKDVIKSSVPKLVEMFLTSYRDDVKDFINMDTISNLNKKDIWKLTIGRTDRNILKYLSTVDFDFDNVLKVLEDAHKELYMLSEPMIYTHVIHTLMNYKFTKVVYIYSEEYDPKIEFDIHEQFSTYGDRIVYIAGNLKDVLESLDNKPTLYALSDISKMDTIIQMGMQEYCEFMIAEYGYNYTIKNGVLVLKGDYESMMEEKIFKFGSFAPINI